MADEPHLTEYSLRCRFCGEVFDNNTGHIIHGLNREQKEAVPVSGNCYPCHLEQSRQDGECSL